MEHNALNINNKIKQKVAGNWGHPSKDEKHERITELNDTLFKTVPIHKHKKRIQKPYISLWRVCPFCQTKLPLDEKKIAEENAKLKHRHLAVWDEMYVVETCPSCKSYKISECPACKNNTWFNPVTRIYKHQHTGCGFEGIKKI